MSATTTTTDTSGILQLRPTVVRASAGTGKTYQLTARMLRILLQGAAPETILATTFTRKAAGEILARVLVTLANAADESDDAALNDLRSQVGLPTLPRSKCRTLLRDLVANIHRLRVSTLDSVFSTLARSLPFELGLPPAWRLTDEIEEEWLRERAIQALITNAEMSELKTLLSMLGGGRVVRSIAREIDQVVQGTYAKQRLCEGEVWNEVHAAKMPPADVLQSTADAFRGADIPQKSLRAKLEMVADFIEQSRLDELSGETLIVNIAKARAQRSEVKFGRSKFPDDLNEPFDVLYGAVRSRVLAILAAQNQATGSLLGIYDDAIGALKQSQRSLGFDDVAVRLARHFSTLVQSTEASLLDRRLDGAIDHLLLDEFQDTAPVQWAVLRPFAMRTTQTDPDRQDQAMAVSRSFFCVGDTKQAIYGFRGGVAEIFDAVTDQLDGVDEVPQNDSYRSSPVVLDFVTEVFQGLRRHPAATAGDGLDDPSSHHADAMTRFSREFPRHTAAKKDLPGHVCISTSASASEIGEKPSKSELKAACFDRAAEVVAELHRADPQRTVGVLTRSRKAAAEMMYRLDRRGLTVSQEGGNPLTDSAAVELVLSALMMVEHPGDLRWTFHVMNSPLGHAIVRQDDSALSSEVGFPRNERPLPAATASDLPRKPGEVSAMLRQYWTDHGLVETVTLLSDLLVSVCNDTDTTRLRQLTQLATSYQPIASPRLSDFVRLVKGKGVEQPKAAKIRVMTVHASKGLEFDSVVLPELDEPLVRQGAGCIADVPDVDQPPQGMTRYVNKKSRHFLSGRWQHAFGRADAADMTEALCLLYVALTRAKHALHLIVQPLKKPGASTNSSASLILHAMDDMGDATQGSSVVFETGSADWHANMPPLAMEDVTGPRSVIKIDFREDARR